MNNKNQTTVFFDCIFLNDQKNKLSTFNVIINDKKSCSLQLRLETISPIFLLGITKILLNIDTDECTTRLEKNSLKVLVRIQGEEKYNIQQYYSNTKENEFGFFLNSN